MRSHEPLVLGLYQHAFFCVTELQKLRGPERFAFYPVTCVAGLLHTSLMKLSETASRKMEEWPQLLFPPQIISKALVRQALPMSQMGHRAWVPGTGFMLGCRAQLQKLGWVHLGKKGKELEVQFQLWAGSSWNGLTVGDFIFS